MSNKTPEANPLLPQLQEEDQSQQEDEFWSEEDDSCSCRPDEVAVLL